MKHKSWKPTLKSQQLERWRWKYTEQVVFSAGCSACNQPAEVSVSQSFITGVWAQQWRLRSWEGEGKEISLLISVSDYISQMRTLQYCRVYWSLIWCFHLKTLNKSVIPVISIITSQFIISTSGCLLNLFFLFQSCDLSLIKNGI